MYTHLLYVTMIYIFCTEKKKGNSLAMVSKSLSRSGHACMLAYGPTKSLHVIYKVLETFENGKDKSQKR